MRNSFLASYNCIDNIYRKKSFSGQELNEFLQNLSPEEKPLTSKLVYGVVDKNIKLSYIIKSFAKSVKPSLLPVLQIGVYCFLYLSIPAPVVVNECVELTKKLGKGGMSGFVNATLKNISNAVMQNNIKYPENRREFLSVYYSFPLWVVDMISEDYTQEIAKKILAHDDGNNFTHVRVNTQNISVEEFEKLLEEKGIFHQKTLDDAFYTDGKVFRLDTKLFTPQSLSSMYVCKAVAAKGKKVLDVCAAPGGKSVYLAQMGNQVTSCDVHLHRTKLIEKYAKRMGADLSVCVNDATVFNESFKNAFDVVLCDVPCSGFGVLSSKPDVKLFKTKQDIFELSKIQSKILKVSSKYVKEGGTLVYSTCTIFKKENDFVVNEFLKNNPDFQVDEIKLDFPKTKEGYIQFLPFRDKTDGFFIARLKRKNV